MKQHFNNIPLEKLNEVVEAIIKVGQAYPIWIFEGNLGAGKTTLIKALANKLGIEDPITSPTFNYVNDYDGRVFHFDAYRLQNLDEALGFGFEEYLDSGKPCWIEWPEVLLPLIPSPYLKIEISHHPDLTRSYILSIA